MPTQPSSKDDDTKVIYRDKLAELTKEIQSANLSQAEWNALEQEVMKKRDECEAAKARIEHGSSRRKKKDDAETSMLPQA